MFRRGSATSFEAVLGSIVVPVARVTLIAPALLPREAVKDWLELRLRCRLDDDGERFRSRSRPDLPSASRSRWDLALKRGIKSSLFSARRVSPGRIVVDSLRAGRPSSGAVGSMHGRFVRACVDGFYWENCCGAREEVFQFDPRNLGPYRLEPFAGGHCYPQRLSWQQVEGDVVEALEIPHCDTPFEFLVLVAKLNARTLAEHHPQHKAANGRVCLQ
uniref:Uncharacterized protein n=1 Tax=Bionectria ochroleuca TaxID=29856 RepID=A0A8H7NGB3_BIOOC